MATFESIVGGRAKEPEIIEKYTYRRVKPAIERFIKVFEIDLGRLQRHQINIHKFQVLQDWSGLNKEQINAHRTIQQLKSTLRQLEQTVSQIEKEDVPKFEAQLNGIHQQCIEAIIEFLNSHGEVYGPVVDENLSNIEQNELTGTPENESKKIDTKEHELIQIQTQIQQVNDEHAQESWEKLRVDLIELNGMVNIFHKQVHEQQVQVDAIEENLDTAQENVEEGVFSLATAAKLKSAMFPVAGAVIGGLLGGPVGVFAGVKIGAAAAVGGGIAGYTGGKLLKDHKEIKVETEMQDLSKNKNSLNTVD